MLKTSKILQDMCGYFDIFWDVFGISDEFVGTFQSS